MNGRKEKQQNGEKRRLSFHGNSPFLFNLADRLSVRKAEQAV
jgi:hypothetical protein